MGAEWMSGLLGRPKARGEAVDDRLRAFVAPIVDVMPDDAVDLDSVRAQYAKVRDSLQGAVSLNQRLNAELAEAEPERPPERVVKGEAFMVKLLEQCRRTRREA